MNYSLKQPKKGASGRETNFAAWPRIVESHMVHMLERKENSMSIWFVAKRFLRHFATGDIDDLAAFFREMPKLR